MNTKNKDWNGIDDKKDTKNTKNTKNIRYLKPLVQEQEIPHIHFGGGGCSCIAFLGALQYLTVFRKDIVDNVKSYSGTSAGSIIALFFTLGIPVQKLIDFMYHQPPKFFNNWKNRNVFMRKIKIVIGTFIKDLDMNTLTFREHFELTGKKLYTVATSVEYKHHEMFFSVDACPDMKILDAIKVSTNIPIIYDVIDMFDDKLVDGSITNDVPDEFCNKNSLIFVVIYETKYLKSKEAFADPYNIFMSCISVMIKSSYFRKKFPNTFVDIQVDNPEVFPSTNVDFLYLSKLMNRGFEYTKAHFKKIE